MNPSRQFILRPIATSLLMIAILLSGLLAWQILPISALPKVDFSTIQVVTLYPGASADIIASNITAPLERQLGKMPGLSQMSSSSSGGASVITLQFNLDLTLDIAEQEVQAAINAAGNLLPQDLPTPPIYSKINPADTPIITLALTSDSLPLTQLEDWANTRLLPKLAEVSGVGLVSLSGGNRPAIRIQSNPHALAARGLTLESIRTAVSSANVNQAKGSFDGAQVAITIDGNDQLKSAEEYRKIVLSYQNGAPVRLQDVANVIDGAENTYLAAWAKHTPAIIINVQRQPDANVIQVVNQIHQLLPQLQQAVPAAAQLSIVSDRTVTIRASVADVEFELILAIALVIMVIFLFLRNVTATLIPAVAVPLSLVGTFGVMHLAGVSINNLTLMALTIATGFVVDDAIVMIENITRYLEEGESPLEAALKGSKQIGFTIISLTFSLIAVLIPLLFMEDVLGRLFREFAITLAVSILISAAVSLTLTPMMCARLLKAKDHGQYATRNGGWVGLLEKVHYQSDQWFNTMIAHYDRALQWVLQRQGFTLMVAVGTLGLTVILYIVVPKGFFPLQDTGAIQGISEAAQSISFSAMAQKQQTLVKVLLEDPAVESISSSIGVDGQNTTLNNGRVFITLIPKDKREDIRTILARLQQRVDAIPSMSLYLQSVQDLTVDALVNRTQYQFTLQANTLDELAMWVPKLTKRLQKEPALSDVTSDLSSHGLHAFVNINRDAAARLGITTAAIDNALYDAFGQRLISTLFTQANQYRVVLEAIVPDQGGIHSINQIYIPTANGRPVPLSAVATIENRYAPLVINRLGQFPTVTVSFNLASGASLDQAVQAIQQNAQQLGLPASIDMRFQGTAQAFQASLSNTLWLMLAAVITMYIVLGVLYESYIHPITILSTLPSAGIGALLALLLSGTELNVIAIIGIILLIGIVKKNAIMMIDFALQAERQQKMAPHEAIYQACLLRFRPILMTTMAALLGALPLMLGGGMGSELRTPLGITMVGGLMFSQILTLFTTPVIYLAFNRLVKNYQSRYQTDTKGT